MEDGTSIYFHYNSPQKPIEWITRFLEELHKLGLRPFGKYPFHIVRETRERIAETAKFIEAFPEATSWTAVFGDATTSTRLRCSAAKSYISPDGIFGFQVDIDEILHPGINYPELSGTALEITVLQYERMKLLFWEMELDWAWAWLLGEFLDPYEVYVFTIFRFTRYGPQKLVVPFELHKSQAAGDYSEWEVEVPLSFSATLRGEAARWITSNVQTKSAKYPPPVKYDYEPISVSGGSPTPTAATNIIVFSPGSEQVLAGIENEILQVLATNLSLFLGSLRLRPDLWISSLQKNKQLSLGLADAAFPELTLWAIEPLLELAGQLPEQGTYLATTAQGWMDGARLGFERDYFDFSEIKQTSNLPELFARIFRIGFEEICDLHPDDAARLPNLLFTYFERESAGNMDPLQKLQDSELDWYRTGYLAAFLSEQILMVARNKTYRSNMAEIPLIQAVHEVLQRAKQKQPILLEPLNDHDCAAVLGLNSDMMRLSNMLRSRQALWRLPNMVDSQLGSLTCPDCSARRARRAGRVG